MTRTSFFTLALLSTLVACAKQGEPLPGDSVQADGSIVLSPPRMNTTPAPVVASASKESAPIGSIERLLFPPELVMEHQSELGIEKSQREAILKEVQKSQAEMVRLQWDLQGAKEKLVKVLDAEHVDERASAEAAAQVMKHESNVKASHLAMLVRVKNLLTTSQQVTLKAKREAH